MHAYLLRILCFGCGLGALWVDVAVGGLAAIRLGVLKFELHA
jgi:hypothetical protein